MIRGGRWSRTNAISAEISCLIELARDQIEQPTHAWVSYAVCAVEEDSCAWQGWILDGVFKDEAILPSDDLNCPRCGRPLYRVGIEYRLDLSADQTPSLVEGVDYQTREAVYDTES